MVTTIQLNQTVKRALGNMKTKTTDTYEDVIVRMLSKLNTIEKNKMQLLKEGYSEMNQESQKIVKEWSSTDQGWD